jgi:predicted type IV restriction endonuclease
MTNEAFARVQIDALLTAQGWNIQDTNCVRFEVVITDGTRADYVLCDRHGRAQAVIEAKRFSASPGKVTSKRCCLRLQIPPQLFCAAFPELTGNAGFAIPKTR